MSFAVWCASVHTPAAQPRTEPYQARGTAVRSRRGETSWRYPLTQHPACGVPRHGADGFRLLTRATTEATTWLREGPLRFRLRNGTRRIESARTGTFAGLTKAGSTCCGLPKSNGRLPLRQARRVQHWLKTGQPGEARPGPATMAQPTKRSMELQGPGHPDNPGNIRAIQLIKQDVSNAPCACGTAKWAQGSH